MRRNLWNAIVATVLWFIRSSTTFKVSSGDGDVSSVVILSIPLSSKTAIFRECQDFLKMEKGLAHVSTKVGDRPKSYEAEE